MVKETRSDLADRWLSQTASADKGAEPRRQNNITAHNYAD